MKTYLNLLQDILDHGEKREDRTGTGTLSVFGRQVRYDLTRGFPLATTKKVHFKSVVHELLWFLTGDTNIKYLKDNQVKIWDDWADEQGNLGPVYGYQWCHWGKSWDAHVSGDAAASAGVDQLTRLVEQIKNNPQSRRHIVTAWNPSDVDQMALPPCHALFQFYVHGDGRLSCQLYQRSADVFLGVPFNIASYALLTMMVAQATGLKAGEFVHSFGDLHLYSNHVAQAKLQLSRKPRPLPQLKLNPDIKNLFDFKFEDFSLENYNPHPGIKAPIAV